MKSQIKTYSKCIEGFLPIISARPAIKLISAQVVDTTRPFVSGCIRSSINGRMTRERPIDEPGEDSGAAFHRVKIYLPNKC